MSLRFLVPLLVIIGMVLWFIVGGLLKNTEKPETATETHNTHMLSVEVQTSSAKPITKEISILGQTKPNRLIKIRAETEGQVKEILVNRGDKVKQGDLLMRLDMKDRKSRLTKAESFMLQRKREYDAAVELGKQGYQGENEIALARANYENALALLAEIKLEIANTEIKAPFDGVFNENNVEIGDFVSKEDIIGVLIELDPILVTGDISQQNIADLRQGDSAEIHFLDKTTKTGVISFISSNAKTETRTFAVEIKVENADNHIRSGTSVDITFPLSEIDCHFISPALLTLNDQGKLGVDTVMKDNETQEVYVVKFYPVEIVKTLPNGLWVSQLPQNVDLIIHGQGFVSDGDKVNIIEKSEK